MKKIISLLLALVMILSLSVTAFAADITQPDNGSKQVTGTYVAGATADTVYSVDITWGDMAFTYTAASEGAWNPADHTTGTGTEAAWSVDNEGGNKVTVTNHSNAAITATVAYESLAAYSAVTGSVTNGTMDLASAVETTLQNAPSATAELTLSGTLPETHSEGAQIGTITVTIGESTGGGQVSAKTFTFLLAPSDGGIGYNTYEAYEGSTWREWINSAFNTIGIQVFEDSSIGYNEAGTAYRINGASANDYLIQYGVYSWLSSPDSSGGADPVITGVAFSGDMVSLSGNTYTITVPTGGSAVYPTITVSGENLKKITDEFLFDYEVALMENGSTKTAVPLYVFNYDESSNTLSKSDALGLNQNITGTYDLVYSTDGKVTWEDTGYDVVIVVGE